MLTFLLKNEGNIKMNVLFTGTNGTVAPEVAKFLLIIVIIL
jgi:hypothetical protein